MKTSKPVNFNLQIAILFTLTLLISACGAVKGLRAIKNKNVKPQYISFKEKSIILTPLAHFSQIEYYDNLKDSIIQWKKNGYTIFYEQIISKAEAMNLDSTFSDQLNRKWRKIVGGVQMTREGYEELSDVFKNGIVQPEYEDLGVDSTDVNADITLYELVTKWEEYYGEVGLDSCDFSTSLDSTYTCSKKLKGKLNPIIVDYRNQQLVNRIVHSELDKIVVVYGEIHIKGMKKLLKEKSTPI